MKQSLLEKLACPFDKHDLSLETYVRDEEGNIREGILTCTQCCRYYPIIFGIPVMSPDEFREMSMERPLLDRWGLKAAAGGPSTFCLSEGYVDKGKLNS